MLQCPQCHQVTLSNSGVCSSCGFVDLGKQAQQPFGRDPFLFKTIGKDFFVRSPLGEGGFARVYIADQQALHRRAVVKILKKELAQNPQIVERFRQEAQLAARLAHPGIAQIFAIGEIPDEGNLPFFAMEYIAGRPLSKILKSEGALEFKRAARLLCLIAEAVDHAHENGVIHRDLKPDNVMIVTRNPMPGDPPGAHENIKVLDFGIAKDESNQKDTGMTKSGEVFGTPFYMSPEQSNGELVTRATDLYSLGIMAYEMFTGRVPFDGPSAGAILLQHMSTPPPRLEDLGGKKFPPALEGALARALSKHPAQRHSSAKEFAAAVAHAVDAKVTFRLSDLAPPPPVLYETPNLQSGAHSFEKNDYKRGEGSKLNPKLLGLALLILLLFSFYLLKLRSQQNQEPPPHEDVSADVPEPIHAPPPKIIPNKPNVGVAMPAGADLATVPPLPAKRENAPPPDTRLLIAIPEGSFLMGAEKPVEVFVSKFFIDAYEVTVEEYAKCVEAKKCHPAQQYLGFRGAKMPMVGVTYDDARYFCAWEKKRLPTEAEWEKAARGTEGRLYPWGKEIDCNLANYGGATDGVSCRSKNPAHTADVGSYPKGVSPYGVSDMSGNVWEWTLDAFEKDFLPAAKAKNPTGPKAPDSQPTKIERVVKGGSWHNEAEEVTTTARKGVAADTKSPEIGFRCVREAE